MRRFAFALIVVLLSVAASGATSLMAGEPCTRHERAGQTQNDGACPPTCVTCGCCAHAAEVAAIHFDRSPDIPFVQPATRIRQVPSTDPRDILHVPRRRPA